METGRRGTEGEEEGDDSQTLDVEGAGGWQLQRVDEVGVVVAAPGGLEAERITCAGGG